MYKFFETHNFATELFFSFDNYLSTKGVFKNKKQNN